MEIHWPEGKAGEAIGLATIASAIGTLFGLICLAIFSPIIGKLALEFGSWEFFTLAVFGCYMREFDSPERPSQRLDSRRLRVAAVSGWSGSHTSISQIHPGDAATNGWAFANTCPGRCVRCRRNYCSHERTQRLQSPDESKKDYPQRGRYPQALEDYPSVGRHQRLRRGDTRGRRRYICLDSV